MVDLGTLSSTLPDSPLSESTIDNLDENEAVDRVIPFLNQSSDESLVIDHFALLLQSGTTVIFGRFPGEGWQIQDRLTQEEDEDDDSYIERVEFAGQVYSYPVMDAIDYYPAPESIDGALVRDKDDYPEPGEVSAEMSQATKQE